MQTCKLRASVCDEIEHMCRDFISGSTLEARKNHLISWTTRCIPKEDGGLGFRNFKMVNATFFMKLEWAL